MARGRDYTLTLAGAFGISFAPILLVLSGVAPTPGAVWRFVWAMPVLVPLCIRARASFRSRAWVPAALLSGAFFAADMALWHRSIGTFGAGPSTLVVNTQVIWIALYGMFALRERPTRAFWLSLPVTFVGLALLAGGDIAGVPSEARLRGLAAALVAGVAYAGVLVCLRRAARTGGPAPEAVLLVQLSVAGPLLALLALAEGTLPVLPRPEQHFWLALLGLGPQAVAWTLITRGLAGLPGHHGGLLLLLQPTSSLILGWLILGQSLGPAALGGASLVLLGIGTTLLAEHHPH